MGDKGTHTVFTNIPSLSLIPPSKYHQFHADTLRQFLDKKITWSQILCGIYFGTLIFVVMRIVLFSDCVCCSVSEKEEDE